MAAPTAKSDIDPNFEAQVTELQAQAAAEQTTRVVGQQALWMRPALNGWDGDLFDWVGMSQPFDRSQANGWFVDAVKDPTDSGTVGDLLVTTIQVDYLSIMERSFRMRHAMGRPRALVQAMGRKLGHGDNTGPLVQSVLEHVRGVVKRNKGAAVPDDSAAADDTGATA